MFNSPRMPTVYEKLAEEEECELEPYKDSVPNTPQPGFTSDNEGLSTLKSHERNVQIKAKVKQVFAACVSAIIPSFLHSSLMKSKKKTEQRKSNIATLDGLRGLSCLFVLNSHWTYSIVNSYWRTTGFKNSHWFWHLPYFQLLWGGGALVDIFFVLSGYVLSCKCIKQIHAASWEPLHKTIASAVIRRGPRIFLPPVFSIFMVFVLARFHAFERAHDIYLDQHYYHKYQLELREQPPVRFDSFATHFVDFLGAVLSLLDPITPLKLESFKSYNSYLWTIPREFYCSMALYVTLLGTSRLKKVVRIGVHIFLALFYAGTVDNAQYLFTAGMVIAELDILWNEYRKKKRSTTHSLSSPIRETSEPSLKNTALRLVKQVSWITYLRAFILVLGLWVLSVPGKAADETPGFQTIMALVPSYFNWDGAQNVVRCTGAILVVWPISNVSTDSTTTSRENGDRLPWWSFKSLVDKALTNPVVHYLGQISFAMYILHGIVIKSIGYCILPPIYKYVVFDAKRRESFEGWNGLSYVNGTWVKDIPASVDLAKTSNIHTALTAASNHITRDTTAEATGLRSLEIALIWILGYLVVLPCTVWAADVFWRLIDQQCISLGHTLEKWMSVMAKKETPVRSEPSTPTPRIPRWQVQARALQN